MGSGHIIPDSVGGQERSPDTRDAPPEPSHAERARTLVAGQSRGALSTIALKPAGTPFGSVVTYGLDGTGQPCFFVSTMAEHTHNLESDPRASLLVVEDTPEGADPLASGRVTLLGTAGTVTDPDERARGPYRLSGRQPGRLLRGLRRLPLRTTGGDRGPLRGRLRPDELGGRLVLCGGGP